MKQRKFLKTSIQHALAVCGFKERYFYEKTETDIILEAVKEFIIQEPTRAMYIFEDGYTESLVSKLNLLDNLQSDKPKEEREK